MTLHAERLASGMMPEQALCRTCVDLWQSEIISGACQAPGPHALQQPPSHALQRPSGAGITEVTGSHFVPTTSSPPKQYLFSSAVTTICCLGTDAYCQYGLLVGQPTA